MVEAEIDISLSRVLNGKKGLLGRKETNDNIHIIDSTDKNINNKVDRNPLVNDNTADIFSTNLTNVNND